MVLAIFDSHQLFGEGVGLQIEGIVKELGKAEVPLAAAIYFKRRYPYGKFHQRFVIALKKLLKVKLYRFYKVTPTKAWMNDPNSDIDIRRLIDLSNLYV